MSTRYKNYSGRSLGEVVWGICGVIVALLLITVMVCVAVLIIAGSIWLSRVIL